MSCQKISTPQLPFLNFQYCVLEKCFKFSFYLLLKWEMFLIYVMYLISYLFFFHPLFSFSQYRPDSYGTCNSNAYGPDACRRRTDFEPEHHRDTQRGASLNSVVNRMSSPPPQTTLDRTETKDTHPISGLKLKFLTPLGIEPGPPGWKAGTLPKCTATDYEFIYPIKIE